MKYTAAIVLIFVAMVAAEAPLSRPVLARQTSSYQPRGWRPSGPGFSLPLKAPASTYGPPVPAASYGPPPQEYGPPTTTETPITTTEVAEEATTTTQTPQAENLKKSEKLKDANEERIQPGGLLVVLPQGQNLVYATPAQIRVAGTQQENVQNVPTFAKIQESPLVAKLEVPVRVQAVPFGFASSTSVLTPYSQSYVQIYQ